MMLFSSLLLGAIVFIAGAAGFVVGVLAERQYQKNKTDQTPLKKEPLRR